MGFAINPSLNYLNLNPPYIVELYKSTAAVALPDARFRGHSFEAYICITKIDAEMRAYVALLNTALQNVLVYTSDFSTKNAADYPQVYAEAENFVTPMGFTMEKVNLEFSAAMKEVILKGFRVMRPPPPPKKQFKSQLNVDVAAELNKALQEADLPPVEKMDQMGEQNQDTLTELQTLRTELGSSRTALAQVTREKVSLEQRFSQELAALKSACEQAVQAKRQAEEELAGSRQQQIDAEEFSALKKQLAMMEEAAEAKEKQLAMVKEAAEDKEKQLRQEMAVLVGKFDQAVNEKSQLEQRFSGEIASSRELLAKANADVQEMAELLEAEKAAHLTVVSRIETLSNAEQSSTEIKKQTEELIQQLSDVTGELAAANAELAKFRQAEQRHEELQRQLALAENELAVARNELEKRSEEEQGVDELRRNLTRVEEELASAKTELEQLRNAGPAREEMSAEISHTLKEKEDVEAEYVRLATTSREKEMELADRLAAAEADNERLSQELEIQVQVAATEQAALRAELRRLLVGGHVTAPALSGQNEPVYPAGAIATAVQRVQAAEPHLAQPAGVLASPLSSSSAPSAQSGLAGSPEPVSIQALEPEEEAPDDSPDEPVVADTEVLKEFTNEFGGFYFGGSTSSTEFAIDPSLDAISYSEPSEIVAVFYSSNTVQAVPDSSNIQRCRGYVVAIKKSGNYQVYVAWHLTETGKVVVCTPDPLPTDSESCIRVLGDAIAYFEIVGFMMDIFDLGTTVRSYNKALKKIPVFRRVNKG